MIRAEAQSICRWKLSSLPGHIAAADNDAGSISAAGTAMCLKGSDCSSCFSSPPGLTLKTQLGDKQHA
jgi:hypothetical protein